MAERSNISWCYGSLNFWIGCMEVSNGLKGACVNCYARTWAARWPRYAGTWGPRSKRVRTVKALAKARKIIREAKKDGVLRPFIFSNSLSDIFDNEVPIEWLSDAFDVMEATPEAVYLLLTKRSGNMVKRWLEVLRYRRRRDNVGGLEPSDGQLLALYRFPKNVALGFTAVTQEEANRDTLTVLEAKIALRPAFLFVSVEPMMGPMDFTAIPYGEPIDNVPSYLDALSGRVWVPAGSWAGSTDNIRGDRHYVDLCQRIDWVITGGESGANARASHPDWFVSLQIQCEEAGVPFHFKQWGAWWPSTPKTIAQANDNTRFKMVSPGIYMEKVGAANSGRTLLGVIHDAQPEVAA